MVDLACPSVMLHDSCHWSPNTQVPLEWQNNSHCPEKLLGKLYSHVNRYLGFWESKR